MNYLRALASRHYWIGISKFGALKAFLSTYGLLWLIVSVTKFFSDSFGNWVHTHWLWFLIVGLVWCLAENYPKHHVSCRLKNRDVTIEIRLGDMFKLKGFAFIVGATTTFETRIGDALISPRSVQGQFTQRFYDSQSHLQSDIAKALALGGATGTLRGTAGVPEYPMGTTLRISTEKATGYLVAITSLNEHGAAKATSEDLKNSLPQLWESISKQGSFEKLAIPVLGSGFSRLPLKRDEIVREIIKSFVAACSDSRPTEFLTIVIPYSDFFQHELDLNELGSFLRHVCQYTDYAQPDARGTGEALAVSAK